MTYATQQDLEVVISPSDLRLLTDQVGEVDEIDSSKLNQALADATAEINGYLTKVTSLPLEDPPDMLKVVCRDLAIFRLYANLGRVSEAQTRLQQSAIKYLEAVAAGRISIGDTTGGDEVETSPGVAVLDGAARVMTRDTLKGF